MAVENALVPACSGHAAPNEITRLMRNLIMGAEFLMSHITHFYALAAISYVQGPAIPPWTPYFDNSYYAGVLMRPQGSGTSATGNPVYEVVRNSAAASGSYDRLLPDAAKMNCPALGLSYTGIDGIWDTVILDYLEALKYRREAANASALLGGRTPQIQNGCVVGGCSQKPTADDVAKYKAIVNGVKGFIENNYIPLTHIVSYLYGGTGGAENTARVYDNKGTPVSGYGAGAATGLGANRVLAWGAFDEDLSGNPANRLLPRGCYEATSTAGAMASIAGGGSDLWNSVKEYIDSSKYVNDTVLGDANKAAAARHPSVGYTKPDEGAAGGYSWAKSPRIQKVVSASTGVACQVGPLARMAVRAEAGGGSYTHPVIGEFGSYDIGSTKPHLAVVASHVNLGPILVGNLATVTGTAYGPLNATITCGFSTMDRHRARAYEALLIATRITETNGWCDQLATAIAGSGAHYTSWTPQAISDGTPKTGYGAHEAPRGALAHFVDVRYGRIHNYQCVVPTTWNVNPYGGGENGPIESAINGIGVSGKLSGGHVVPVEVMRVIQGFDPCIACTVH